MAQLLPVLQKAADVWFLLGLMLGVPAYHLRVLEQQYKSPYDSLTHMLLWLYDNITITWDSVLTTLCDINRRELAKELCDLNGADTQACTQLRIYTTLMYVL